jgi:hypothetical protein
MTAFVVVIPCFWYIEYHTNKIKSGEYNGDPFVPTPAEVRDNEAADQGAKRIATCNSVPRKTSANNNKEGKETKHVYPHLCAALVDEVQILEYTLAI